MLSVSAMLIHVISLWHPSPCAGGQLEGRLPLDVWGLRWPVLTCYASRACLHIWALGNIGVKSRSWAEEAGLARTSKKAKILLFLPHHLCLLLFLEL